MYVLLPFNRLHAIILWLIILLGFAIRAVLGPHLVAMGSFMSADPTRIIAKRIILTGHPFKVHRKTATVRYMFFNRGQYPPTVPQGKLRGCRCQSC
jgi:hypothetical protein